MNLLSSLRASLNTYKQKRAALTNGKHLKAVLKKAAKERDRIEQQTGKRPEIDETTRLYMQKVLNVWINQGKHIDEEKFWHEVDHNRQFDHPVEFYQTKRK